MKRMRLAGFLLSSPLAWHADLVCRPAMPAKFGALIDAFLPLIDAFPAPIDAPFTDFSLHQSLIDALFTCARAIAHRQVDTSSISD
ncbi:hypothetical protein [Corynebacterium amycolatum]|uniref:hypothetical protein n=2 Tax=Corynebacteriaceae TaxID=1653 RepID=UPI002159F535|nr:hypothetical protein [Corynebacterium amycolatum]UVE01170.1 hypothetical protein NU639_03275 [Corynebacterium amycolatum]